MTTDALHEMLLDALESLGDECTWKVEIKDGMVHAKGDLRIEGQSYELNGMEFESLLTTREHCEEFAKRLADDWNMECIRQEIVKRVNEPPVSATSFPF